MKGIILGCIHYGLNYKGINFNPRIWNIMKHIHEEVSEKKLDLIVFLGDVLHNNRVSYEAMNYLIQTFRLFIDIPSYPRIFVLAGNHDKNKFQDDNATLFDFLNSIQFPRVSFFKDSIHTFKFAQFPKYNFLLIPYYVDGEIITSLNIENKISRILKESEGEDFIAFTHFSLPKYIQSIQGSEIEMYAGKDLVIPNILLESRQVKKIYNGHLHVSQVHDKVICPGSIDSFRFGEGNEKYYLEVEF